MSRLRSIPRLAPAGFRRPAGVLQSWSTPTRRPGTGIPPAALEARLWEARASSPSTRRTAIRTRVVRAAPPGATELAGDPDPLEVARRSPGSGWAPMRSGDRRWIAQASMRCATHTPSIAVRSRGAMAALEDRAHHRLIVSTVIRERARAERPSRWPGVRVEPSRRISSSRRHLRGPPGRRRDPAPGARILVRHFTVPGLDAVPRITVGDARADRSRLAAVLASTGKS